MAAAAHVTANVYGMIQGQAPYIGSNSSDAFARQIDFSTPRVMSFPTTGTVFHPVTPGQRVGLTTNYIYSVIEITDNGQIGQPMNIKYGAGESVTTLATNAG